MLTPQPFDPLNPRGIDKTSRYDEEAKAFQWLALVVVDLVAFVTFAAIALTR
jgi:hypothetical protein